MHTVPENEGAFQYTAHSLQKIPDDPEIPDGKKRFPSDLDRLDFFIKGNTVLELVQKYFICHTIPPVMLLSHIKMWILLIIDPETDFPVDKFSVRRESIW